MFTHPPARQHQGQRVDSGDLLLGVDLLEAHVPDELHAVQRLLVLDAGHPEGGKELPVHLGEDRQRVVTRARLTRDKEYYNLENYKEFNNYYYKLNAMQFIHHLRRFDSNL